ncbi:hypothetical protein BRADI_2g58177v3 [Brachypodium distachyon]|uniref:Uncharacterized protein n=1 Tax=Brachypodium distachyon TaxID=15368 RepID=A0A2K2DGM0_BRADI|nr:hypothetical protein BRADI_2g58177v3 [Brachypodium distachyon]
MSVRTASKPRLSGDQQILPHSQFSPLRRRCPWTIMPARTRGPGCALAPEAELRRPPAQEYKQLPEIEGPQPGSVNSRRPLASRGKSSTME